MQIRRASFASCSAKISVCIISVFLTKRQFQKKAVEHLKRTLSLKQWRLHRIDEYKIDIRWSSRTIPVSRSLRWAARREFFPRVTPAKTLATKKTLISYLASLRGEMRRSISDRRAFIA